MSDQIPFLSSAVNPHVSRETFGCQKSDTCEPPGEQVLSSPTRLDSIGSFQQRCRIVGWISKPGQSFPVLCGRWECQTCARRKGQEAWKRIKASPAMQFQRLCTLPFYVGKKRTWEEAIDISGKSLNAFFVSLRRVIPGIRYLWIREIGKKSNMVHFHVLVDRFLPKSLLSKLWFRAGGGYIVDIGS